MLRLTRIACASRALSNSRASLRSARRASLAMPSSLARMPAATAASVQACGLGDTMLDGAIRSSVSLMTRRLSAVPGWRGSRMPIVTASSARATALWTTLRSTSNAWMAGGSPPFLRASM